MQQRQLRLGDILDDYCPRERRVTNHAVVAMIGADVKQTRCTTCDAEHEYKHAKVPRQRRKPDSPAALIAQGAATPKRVPHEQEASQDSLEPETIEQPAEMEIAVQEAPTEEPSALAAGEASANDADDTSDAESSGNEPGTEEEGPVHRPLIRATLPRVGGQPPAPRPAPEFTIRQPGGRQNRFRQRHGGGGGQQFFGNRSNGNQGGGRQHGGWNPRQPDGQRPRRHGQRDKRSK
jgi:hypothetical protein